MMRIKNYFIIFAAVFAITSACAFVGTQDVKAQDSMSDLIKRIEALESKGAAGNVSAPKIRGIKIGGHIRHRFEMQHHFGVTAAGASTSGGANINSGANDYVEDFTLQRTKIFFDLDVNKNVRGFIQLMDVRTWGFEV